MGYRDRSLIILVIGVLMLLIGIVAAFLGPLGIYCFHLFSGRSASMGNACWFLTPSVTVAIEWVLSLGRLR